MIDSPSPQANHPPDKPGHVAVSQPTSGLGLASMILGIVSFTGPGLILGIPAIIMAAIDLKKKTPSRGFALTGLITGIISTVISLLVVGLVIFFSVWAYNHPEDFDDYYQDTPQTEHQFKSSEL
jgi:hypothetical protein